MAIIKRFGFDQLRRLFLKNSAKGCLAAGLFGSAWEAFSRTGDSALAYPEEFLSIESYSRGRLLAGDVISAENVHLVKDLLDPIRYEQVAQQGRRLVLAATTTDLSRLIPAAYVDATVRNRGLAVFDRTGNVVTRQGGPWIGGNPFPEPTTPTEVFAAHTLSWGRHDAAFYVSREYDLDEDGTLQYQYDTGWAEMSPTGRISLDPKPTLPGEENTLRYQSVFFVEPQDFRGTAYLSIWPYDQSKLPELYGYLPAFKRIRRLPTNQRFEPLTPGAELYLSDAWAAGDPFLTWGNYTLVGRGPYLGAVSGGWASGHPNWEHGVHGGGKGATFWDTVVELVPEVLVIDAEPTGFPRAPVSRKRVWFDARTLVPLAMLSFDRNGAPFRFFDGAFSCYESTDARVPDGKDPYWSWTTLHAYNVQTRRMTRVEQVKRIAGGHTMRVNDPEIYERYLTKSAIQRL